MKKQLSIVTAALLLAAPLYADNYFDDDECRYKEARNLTTPSAGVTRVIIHGESGSLTVDGRAGASQVTVLGQACTSDDDFLPRMTLTARRSGGDLHIDAHIADKTVIFGFFQARLDFAVTIPAGVPVEIEDGSGWIKVSNTGATTIEDGSGSIDIRNVRGDLRITDGSGEIEVRDVVGRVKIEDNSGELTVRNVNGDVSVNDGSGAITVRDVIGSVRIPDDGSGSISIENVRRDVIIDDDGSGSIDVDGVGGNFTVHQKGAGGIDYERVTGKVDIPERKRGR
jgi:hypothetical protein